MHLGAFILSALIVISAGTPAFSDAYNNNVARQAWTTLAKIENHYGIPRGLLHSMSLVETGQGLSGKVMPWPYTVGVNPTGKRKSDSVRAALREMDKLRQMGFTRFDITYGETKRTNLSATAAESILSAQEGSDFSVRGRHFSKRFENKDEAVNFVQNILDKGYKNVDIGLMQINWRYHSEGFANLGEAFEPYHNAKYAVSYLKKHRKTRDWWDSVGRYHSGTEKHATRYIKNVWNMYQRVHRLS